MGWFDKHCEKCGMTVDKKKHPSVLAGIFAQMNMPKTMQKR